MRKTSGAVVAVMVVAMAIGTFITANFAAAGEIGRDGRFIAYDNGTVLDTKTNLMWAAKDNGSEINWVNAKYYCENYRGGGYTDWRMPTQDELEGLYDGTLMGYAQDCGSQYGRVKITGFISMTCCCPWAVETIGSEGGYFSFNYGLRYFYPKSYVSVGRALPVRSVERKQAAVVSSEPQELPVIARAAVAGESDSKKLEKRRATVSIEFETDKAEIKPRYRDDIKKFADIMNMNPGLNVVIEGHTDSVGSAAYNQELSERRANSLKEYLAKEFSIAESRLTAKGFGISRPIDTNETPAGAQKNRRVETTIEYTIKE